MYSEVSDSEWSATCNRKQSYEQTAKGIMIIGNKKEFRDSATPNLHNKAQAS